MNVFKFRTNRARSKKFNIENFDVLFPPLDFYQKIK